MLNINEVRIAGKVVGQPTTRITGSGKSCTTFDVQVTRTWKDKTTVTLVSIESWSDTARTLGEGIPVYLTGYAKLDTWQHNGKEYSKVKIIADALQVMSGRPIEAETQVEPEPLRMIPTSAGSTPDDEPPF